MPNSPRTLKDLPSPKEHWLKGSLGQFKPSEIHTYLYRNANALGSIYKIRLLTKPVVVISNAPVVSDILKQRPSRYRRVKTMESTFKEMGIHGAFSAEGEEWKKYRQLIAPAFKPSNLKRMLPIIQKSLDRFIAQLGQQNEPFDIQDSLKKLLVDITSELAFGYDINTLNNPDSELQSHLNAVFGHLGRRTKSPIPYWRVIKRQCDKELDVSLAFVRKAVMQFIRTTKEHLPTEHEPHNILEALLLAKDEQGQAFSEEVIYGNVITLLLAGEDTTANTLAWAVYHLTQNPSLQSTLREEITRNYPCEGRLQWQDIDNFPLTFGACQEALRLEPTAPFLFLEPLGDEVIDGVYIPKGTTVVVLLAAGNHDETLFKDSNQFNPGRWPAFSTEQKKQSAVALAPFGGGPRLCPGMQLSLIEQKVILIELIKHFNIALDNNNAPVNSEYRFAVSPTNLVVSVTAAKLLHPNSAAPKAQHTPINNLTPEEPIV